MEVLLEVTGSGGTLASRRLHVFIIPESMVKLTATASYSFDGVDLSSTWNLYCDC